MKPCVLSAVCAFEKFTTWQTLFFDLYIIIGTIIMFFLLRKLQKKFLSRYLIIATGVFIFEAFTAPMWGNAHLGRFAYMYQDVSWILNLGWTTLILSTIIVVDHFYKKLSEGRRFMIYIILLTVLVSLYEAVVVKIGIRTYASEVLLLVHNQYLPLLHIPIQSLYYIPVFMTMVICFYKYWNFVLEDQPVVPMKRNKFIRKFLLAVAGVFLFELMIDPLVMNAHFPSWSYVYRDLTLVMTGIWIIILWIGSTIVEKFFLHLDLIKRFVLTLCIETMLFLPVEAWMILNGHRVYGESAKANFSGFYTPFFHLPVEVIFAVPFYLALMITFIRYWEIIIDNKK